MEVACHNVQSPGGRGEWIGSVVLFARSVCIVRGSFSERYSVLVVAATPGSANSWHDGVLEDIYIKVILF